MIISPSNLSLFFVSLDTLYSQAFEQAPIWSPQIATLYPASTETWVQGWLGQLDKLREWIGPRVTRTPAPQTYSATIKNFELTESIDKFKLQDDQHGIYYPIATHIGQMCKKWPDYNVRDLLQGAGSYAGIAQIGTDGVTEWNTAHPVDFYDASKGTYPNDYGTAGVSVNGVTVGGAFSTNGYATVWEDMAGRKNESNEAIGVLPDLTMVPPTLGFPGKALLQSQFFSPPQLGTLGSGSGANAAFVGNIDNPLRGSTDLLINPDINNQPGAWYMLATKMAIKPFGWVLRQAPFMVPRMDPTDPAVFDTHSFIWGAEARGVAVWSLPWMASRSGI